MAMFAGETLENEKSTAKKQTRFRVFTVGTPSVGQPSSLRSCFGEVSCRLRLLTGSHLRVPRTGE